MKSLQDKLDELNKEIKYLRQESSKEADSGVKVQMWTAIRELQKRQFFLEDQISMSKFIDVFIIDSKLFIEMN